jgi:hypothetical protein
MAKVLLALFVGLFRRRPIPHDGGTDPSEGRPLAPSATVSGAGGEPEAR